MAKRRGDEDGLVYSTDPERRASASRGGTANRDPGAGPVRVRRELKGRRGKTVTTISGVPLDPAELAILAKELKQKCGAGGTVKDGVVEIQGDHADKVVALLSGRGWDVKRSGG